MKVRLLEPHVIFGALHPAGEELELTEPSQVTLDMVPLDQQALAAMQAEYDRAFDKYQGLYYKWWVAQYGVRGSQPESVHTDPVVVPNTVPPPHPQRPPIIPPPKWPVVLPSIGKVKLLASHFIGDVFYEANSIVDLVDPIQATPLMEGLDDVTRSAVLQSQRRVWERHPEVPYNVRSFGQPLDSPPIPRPLDDNQPVDRFHSRNYKDYIS